MPTNLGDLLRGVGLEASDNPVVPEPAASEPTPETRPSFAAKVVVRRSRKGRGGKTVTLVEGVLDDRLARAVRKQLGVGARQEGDTLVVQGDQVERVVAWLEAQGARRIVRG